MTKVNKYFYLEKQEKLVIATLLLVVAVFTIFDVIEDYLDGAPITHIIPEVLIIIATSLIALYSFIKFTKIRKVIAEEALEASSKQVSKLKDKTQELKKGLSETVSRQLNEWTLSKSEQEIAFLLIKGLSLREIAKIRQTSEQTIRQQSSIIYKKSGLSGRAQLSAYFLEDFLSFE